MTAKLYQHLIAFNQALTFLSRLYLPGVPAKQAGGQTQGQINGQATTQPETGSENKSEAQSELDLAPEAEDQNGPQTCLQGMVIFFPAVAMLLAALAVLPLWLGLAAAYPWLQALIFLLLTVWLSRGLHWDGLADLLDACASNASGEKFQAILKDHYIGALGALGLMLVLLTNLAILYYLAASKQWLVLIWSAGAGQLTAFCLALFAPVNPAASLGKIFGAARLKLCLALWLPLLLLSGATLISWQFSLCALVFAGLTAFYLACLAKKHGGYNGDFLGAAIVLGQMAALLGAMCFATT